MFKLPPSPTLRSVIWRHRIGILAVAPIVALIAVGGCDNRAPDDICQWLADGSTCYTRYADDVGTQCGAPPTDGPTGDPSEVATGFFAARDDLSLCIRNTGGQILFDPPLDLTMFPVSAVAFTVLDDQAETCGTFSASGPQTFSLSVVASQSDGIIGGDVTFAKLEGRDAFEHTCGAESQLFNPLELSKCRDSQPLLPTATIESSPGIAETQTTEGRSGYVRLRVSFPPASGSTSPRVVEYFNCQIPAPPPPCADGAKNNDESDIDCGGSCAARCAEGQSCREDGDCLINNCAFDAGIRKCLVP